MIIQLDGGYTTVEDWTGLAVLLNPNTVFHQREFHLHGKNSMQEISLQEQAMNRCFG